MDKDLDIKFILNIQGTKAAGHDWYKLLSGIFLNLGMVRSSSEHGIYTWNFKGDQVYKTSTPSMK